MAGATADDAATVFLAAEDTEPKVVTKSQLGGEARQRLGTLMEMSASSDLMEILSDTTYPGYVPHVSTTPARALLHASMLGETERHDEPFGKWGRDEAMRVLPWDFLWNWRSNCDVPAHCDESLTRCREIVDGADNLRYISDDEPFMPDDFERRTKVINGLVDALLECVYAPSQRQGALNPDSGFNMIRMLRSGGYPSYRYSQTEPEDVVAARSRLDAANKSIFEHWEPLRKDTLTAKICYNLLTTKFAPSIGNCNTLMLGFIELGEHDLAQAVVDSFLSSGPVFQSPLRPNVGTLLCILHHYRRKRDPVNFQGIMRRLIGRDGGIGLMSHREPAWVRPSYLRWPRDRKVVLIDDFRVEGAPLGQPVLEAILQGLVDLRMVRSGAAVFIACIESGFHVNIELQNRLLGMCVATLDVSTARAIIDVFLRKMKGPILKRIVSGRWMGLNKNVRRLLNIAWGQCFRMGEAPFYRYRSNLYRFSPEPDAAWISNQVRCLAVLLWTQDIVHHLSRIRVLLKGIESYLSNRESILQDAGRDLDRHRRGDLLVRGFLDRMCVEEERLAYQRVLNRRLRLMARVNWLSEEVEFSSRVIELAKGELVRALIRHEPWTEILVLLDSAPLDSTVALFSELQTPGSQASRIASCFLESKDADDNFRGTLWELLSILTPADEWQSTQHMAKAVSPDVLFSVVSETCRTIEREGWAAHRRDEKAEAWWELEARGEHPTGPRGADGLDRLEASLAAGYEPAQIAAWNPTF